MGPFDGLFFKRHLIDDSESIAPERFKDARLEARRLTTGSTGAAQATSIVL